MRPVGTAHDLEVRRYCAVQLMEEQDLSAAQVAEIVGATERTVRRWRQQAREGGEEALAAKPHPSPPRKLNDQQRTELVQIMLRGARAAGFMNDTWTCSRVGEVIEREFGIEYDLGHLSRILRSLDFTPQLPQRVPKERDPGAVDRWRRDDWPRIKKGRREAS